MIIQAYNDGSVNIFGGKKQFDDVICSFSVSPPLKPLIDGHLKRLRMKRRTKWKDTDWGSEAKVRWRQMPE